MTDDRKLSHVFSPKDKDLGLSQFSTVADTFASDLEELSLTIRGCKTFDNAPLLYISSRFPANLHSLLLDLAGCTKIDDEGFTELSKQIPAELCHLSLDISSLEPFKLTMHISEKGFTNFVKALPSKLTHLDLNLSSCMRIGNDGILGLAECLPVLLQHLRLRFSGCSLILDTGIAGLAQSFPKCLEYLEMEMFGCKRVGDQGLLAISQALPRNLTQLHLDFRCCDRITGPGVVGLARSLPTSLSNLALNFEKCDVDVKVKAMTESLESMQEWHKALLLQDAARATGDHPEDIADVANLLRHKECLIRKEAVECLGKLGDAALPHLQALLECVDDADSTVWPAAAEALVTLGVTSRPEDSRVNEVASRLGDAIKRLSNKLFSENGDMRKGAAEALYHFGSAITPHAAALSTRFVDDDIDARKAAVMAMGALAAANAEAAVPFAPKLISCALGDDDSEVRLAAGTALGALGELCKPSAQSLVEQLSKGDEPTKVAALEALGRLGQMAVPHAVQISRCLGAEDWRVRRAAAEAMGSLGAAAEPYVQALVILLDSKDIRGQRKVDVAMHVRLAAVEALCRLPNEALRSIPPYDLAMIAAGRRGGHDLHKKAREVLVGMCDPEHISVLMELLNNPEWKVRLQTVLCLAPLGEIIIPQVPILLERLDDRSINVRLSVAQLLMNLPLNDDTLKAKVYGVVAFSGHGDPRLAAQAKDAFKVLDSKLRADTLGAMLNHTNLRVRRGAVDGLALLGDAAVPHVMDVVKLFSDAHYIVQKAAAYTLEKLKKAVSSKPPTVSGHLLKQSPSKFRLGQYQKRFVIIRSGRFFWWESQDKAQLPAADTAVGGPDCKGCLDFRSNPCEVVTVPCSTTKGDADGEQERFVLRPSGGVWHKGGTFTGSGRGREFQLDAKESELPAAGWTYLIKCHIAHAMQDAAKSEAKEDRRTSRIRSSSVPRWRQSENSFEINDLELNEEETEDQPNPSHHERNGRRSFRSILFPNSRRREKSMGPARVDYVDRGLAVEATYSQQYER